MKPSINKLTVVCCEDCKCHDDTNSNEYSISNCTWCSHWQKVVPNWGWCYIGYAYKEEK